MIQSHLITSEKLLLVIEAVSLDGCKLVFVLLNYFLQLNVQLLLLLLKKLLFLEEEQVTIREDTSDRPTLNTEARRRASWPHFYRNRR